ncbi:hypothetical protein [Neptunomonas japonica]|nr:hypothetical protein [Neptunomonas japonica]
MSACTDGVNYKQVIYRLSWLFSVGAEPEGAGIEGQGLGWKKYVHYHQ